MKHLTIQQQEKLLNLKMDLFEQNLNQHIIDLKRGNKFLTWSNDLGDWIDFKNLNADQRLVDNAKKEIELNIHRTKYSLVIFSQQFTEGVKKMVDALKQLSDSMKEIKRVKTFPNGGIICGTGHADGKEFVITKPNPESTKNLLKAINETPADGGILAKHWSDNLSEYLKPHEMPAEEVIEVCHCCGKASEYECRDCERQMCGNCQAPYNQFSQIDYNCCTSCYASNRE